MSALDTDELIESPFFSSGHLDLWVMNFILGCGATSKISPDPGTVGRDALSPDRSSRRIYFSAGGFTDDFQKTAEEDGGILLLTLSDLYPEK